MRRSLAVLLFSLLLAHHAHASEPPKVVVSIKPIHSLAAALMDGVGKPGLIVEGEAAPQTFRLDTAKRREATSADLLIWVGPELEPFLTTVTASKPKEQVIELLSLDAIKILSERGHPERRDPYLWLDTRNALLLLPLLTEALAQIDPARAHLYRNNLRKVRRDLAELDRKFEYGYRSVSGRPVLIYHDTQQYFEQAYAMRAIGYLAERVGESASARRLLEAKRALAEGAGVVCLLTEAGLPAGNLDLLADGGQRVRVVELDSLGTRLAAGPTLYRTLMEHNFSAIHSCFESVR
ncbi:MAG: zinc ABC transporter substrate-binding protein [Gammaproteobacteria bacterium]